MQIFDISRPLSNDLAPWPGDTPFHFELKWKMAEGATVNVGAIRMGAHNGTHADAVFHFEDDADTIERMPLEIYLGDAVVADLTTLFSGGQSVLDRTRQIAVADIEACSDALGSAPRLLLKTGFWKDSKNFPDWIPAISPEVPRWLRARKVKLLGLDLPSVDPIDSKTLANHHALAGAGIAIVESLDLSDISAGIYHFSALPLRIRDGDAAPVRAILWRD
jgi:arylformamidase